MRRIARKEEKPVTIIKESIAVPEDPPAPVTILSRGSNLSLKQEKKQPKVEKRVPCFLSSKNGDYKEYGNTVIFPSRGMAKKMRNQLNQKMGTEHWFVYKALIPEKKIIQPETNDEGELGGWGGWCGMGL